MAMKQTQTKLFDFADVGLDFCVGSKSLFPDRFKKMLAIGYNTQTVVSVAVAGNQVTLTYGVSHGYVADRVLKVESGVLTGINGGEFWIDSVTSNTVTLTIDDAPVSIAGAFTTKIASLGWELVFEQPYIHVYKFKHIDDTDMYIRLCFQNNATYRNRVAPCVGRTYDAATGFITDELALSDTKSITTPNIYAWDFSYSTSNSYNNFTYSQGFSTFGRALVVGSLYHLVFMHSKEHESWFNQGVFPTTGGFGVPAILCDSYGDPAQSNSYGFAYLGKIMLGNNTCISKLTNNNEITNNFDIYPQATDSLLPASLNGFNTTTTEPVAMYIQGNGQFLGFMMGIYRCKYANNNAPAISKSAMPLKTMDIDLNSIVYVNPITSGGTNIGYATYYAIPVEEIKIA